MLILLILTNVGLDFRPNLLLLDISLPKGFSTPQITLNFQGSEKEKISAGEISSFLLDPPQSMWIEFVRQPLIRTQDFTLIESIADEASLITSWTARIPQYQAEMPQVRRMIFLLQDEQINYELFTDDVEWVVDQMNGLLIAERPTQADSQPQQIILIKKEPLSEGDSLESPSLGIDAVFIIWDEPAPIRFETITLAHRFDVLDFNLPLFVWDAEAIAKTFDWSAVEGEKLIENDVLLVDSEYEARFSIKHEDVQSITYHLAEARISQYRRTLSLLTVLTGVILFLALGLAKKIICRKETNLNLITLAILVFFFLGLISAVVQMCYPIRLLLVSALVFVLAVLIITHLYLKRGPFKDIEMVSFKPVKKETFWVVVLLLVGVSVLFFRLGGQDFWEDEYPVVNTAAGYLQTGQLSQWDWIEQDITSSYDRAWPHTLLIVQSFRIFGISEWSARLISVLFGIGFYILFYFIARYFTNKQIALLSLFSVVLLPSYIKAFRYARMYALLLPLFLLLAYLIYRGITGTCRPRTGIVFFDKLFGNVLNFDYKHLLLAIPLFVLNYLIHVNSLIILPAAFLFICVLAIVEKKKKYIFLAVFGILAISGFMLFILMSNVINQIDFPWFFRFLSAFNMRNNIYFDYLTFHPFGVVAGFSLMCLTAFVVYSKRKKPGIFHKHLYLFVIVITSLIFFVFIANNVPGYLYISHVTPFAIMIIISGFWYLSRMYIKKFSITVLLLMIFVVYNFSNRAVELYVHDDLHGDYSTAYQVILDNYQPEADVIFGQYLRTYYLQDLEGAEIISLQNNKSYTFAEFRDDLNQQTSGWLTWETIKSYHIDDQIRLFTEQYFQKLHGSGVDETGVEVYYFNRQVDPGREYIGGPQ